MNVEDHPVFLSGVAYSYIIYKGYSCKNKMKKTREHKVGTYYFNMVAVLYVSPLMACKMKTSRIFHSAHTRWW